MWYIYLDKLTNHVMKMFVNNGLNFVLYALFNWYINNQNKSVQLIEIKFNVDSLEPSLFYYI
jgi:hypothetical protein